MKNGKETKWTKSSISDFLSLVQLCPKQLCTQRYEVYTHSLSSPGHGIPGRSGTQGKTKRKETKINIANLKHTHYIEF